MKKSNTPKNTFELALLKKQLSYDVKLQENNMGNEIIRLKSTITELLKVSAIIQGQRLAIHLLTKWLNRKR